MPASRTPSEDASAPLRRHDDAMEHSAYAFRFPRLDPSVDQDGEWCEAHIDGSWRRIRLHDYGEIYRQPGLYESLFAEALQCASPERVTELLRESMREDGADPRSLVAIDVGAGNGMVGERLRAIGVRGVVGVDIIPEAKMAAQRDRPGVYDDYIVADLTGLTLEDRARLTARGFNALTTVAALGFGDMPPRAFTTAYNLVLDGGWIAFNVKEQFLRGEDESGFSRLMWSMITDGVIHMHAFRRSFHRLTVRKERLHYISMVGRKLQDIPEAMLTAAECG